MGDKLAFPATTIDRDGPFLSRVYHGGMTLRDYFAGQAIIATIALDKDHEQSPEGLAFDAYEIADAMMEQRKVTA